MISDPLIIAAMQQDTSRLLLLCDLAWPTGNIYTHTRVGEKYWDSRKWIGVGQNASIEAAGTGTDLGDMLMRLQTTDLAIVNDAVSDNAVSSAVKVYLACTDEYRRIQAAELLIYRFINSVEAETGPVKLIQLSLVGARARFKAAQSYLRYSSKAWRKAYPDDSYCDDIEAIEASQLKNYDGSNSVGSTSSGGNSSTRKQN